MSHTDILVLIDTWLYENHILECHNNIILKFFTKYIVHLVFCSNLLQTETLHPENKLIKIEEVMKFTKVMKKIKLEISESSWDIQITRLPFTS